MIVCYCLSVFIVYNAVAMRLVKPRANETKETSRTSRNVGSFWKLN